MKLLFDEHLSPHLVGRLADLFAGSAHVHAVGLGMVDDREVWLHAKANGFAIVTKDADFPDLAIAWGAPPKVVWIRLGNCTTAAVESLLRANAAAVIEFCQRADEGILALGN